MALRSSGSAGPSGMDAATLKCLRNSFKSSSNLLCDALASFARRLAFECVDPKGVAASLLVVCTTKQESRRPTHWCL